MVSLSKCAWLVLGVADAQDHFLASLNSSVNVGCKGGSLNRCLRSCVSHDDSSGGECESDGTTDCSKSRCCKGKSDKCYTKNQYWAACKGSCRKGEHDSYDSSPWDCKSLRPKTNPLVKCVKKCQTKRGDEKSCVGGCLYASSSGTGSCEKDGATDCSKSKCCVNKGESCFTKNNFWAACKASCKPGEHDDYDKEKWTCNEIDGSGGGSMGTCVKGCVDTCSDGPAPAPPPPATGWNQCRGGLQYTVDGQLRTAYVMDNALNDHGEVVKVSGNSITLGHGPRVYLSSRCDKTISPDMFLKLNLMGKTMEYDLDLSKVGCGCNAAFYFVSMPAGVRTECSDYYCDANAVCGSNCAELDIQEGNTHAWATTPHNAYDGKGCEKRADNYGPGKTIDPARGPIEVKTVFHADRMETVLTQNGHGISIHHDSSCGDNLQNIWKDMGATGMVPTFSNWGSGHKNMDWLDDDVCGNQACNYGAFTVSNIRITGGDPSPHILPPSPSTRRRTFRRRRRRTAVEV